MKNIALLFATILLAAKAQAQMGCVKLQNNTGCTIYVSLRTASSCAGPISAISKIFTVAPYSSGLGYCVMGSPPLWFSAPPPSTDVFVSAKIDQGNPVSCTASALNIGCLPGMAASATYYPPSNCNSCSQVTAVWNAANSYIDFNP